RRSLRLLSGGMCLGAVASVLRVWGDFLGLSPYLVLNTVTQTEVLGPMRRESVMLATLGYGVLYAVLMTAFFVMLFHAARYGVVPVRRVGRKP
ncbi:MAG: cytochrome ubiquinol oxidase subunit I, partial [Burkholderiaceae bacterium]